LSEKNIPQNQGYPVKDTTDMLRKGMQGATHYAQNAIEDAVKSGQDATQNLVNNVIKRTNK
jgi:adenylate kinase family enzyme